MRAATIVMCLLGLTPAARADETSFFTGNDLLQLCEPAKASECIGYVTGVIDGAGALADYLKHPGGPCPPDGVKGSQVVEVVKKYLKDHPEKRLWTAGGLVMDAISEAFQCRW